MRKLIIAGTLLLIATPAFARHHPSRELTTRRIDVAAIEAQDRGGKRSTRHRRLSHHSGKHSHLSHKSQPRHHTRKMAGHLRQEARLEAESAPKAPQPQPIIIDTEPQQSILEANALAIGNMIGEPQGFADGMAEPRPPVVHSRPYHITGKIKIADAEFDFASGGNGWSIPYGDHKITPEAVGRWGRRHGAIGIADDEIADPQLGRTREGIEIHAASHFASAGCIAIEGFERAKHAILHMIETAGAAFLHVWPAGVVITPHKASPFAPVIYLAERVTDKDSYRDTGERRHDQKRKPHRVVRADHHRHRYAHHHLKHYAKA